MASFRYSADARRQLTEIWTYTEAKWGAAQANRYLREIDSRITLALKMPSLLRPRPEIAEGLFALNAQSHVIFARRERDGDLAIIAILHQKMDAKTRLSDE